MVWDCVVSPRPGAGPGGSCRAGASAASAASGPAGGQHSSMTTPTAKRTHGAENRRISAMSRYVSHIMGGTFKTLKIIDGAEYRVGKCNVLSRYIYLWTNLGSVVIGV